MLDFLLSCLNSFWPTSAGIFWIDDLNEGKIFIEAYHYNDLLREAVFPNVAILFISSSN